MAAYTGTPNDDFYIGTEEADTIIGLAGSDILYGEGGDDVIFGGQGKDQLSGGDGDDLLNGNTGDDILLGGRGLDRFNGGEGFDQVSFLSAGTTAGLFVDLSRQLVLNDGFGNRERLTSIEGVVAGTLYDDRIYGSDGANVLVGGDGDVLRGYGGNDEIRLQGGNEARVDGGDGIDTLVMEGRRLFGFIGDSPLNQLANAGVQVNLSNNTVIDDGFGGRGRVTNVENVSGDVLDDRIIGNDGANILRGFDGNDRLMGRGGDDRLEGKTGDDILQGDTGNDTLFGGGGADRLDGGEGDDAIYSGAGKDVLVGGAGSDVFYFNRGDSGTNRSDADRIADFQQRPLDQSGPGDLIGLAAIDAIAGGADDAFTFIGTAAFSGAAGEARYEVIGGDTFVFLETNGYRGADMVIALDGAFALTAADFQL